MNLNINTNALEELKKRKFAVIYGANETGKTYFVNQLQGLMGDHKGVRLNRINFHNFLEDGKISYLENLKYIFDRSLEDAFEDKSEYVLIDNFSGLYWKEMAEFYIKIREKIPENKSLYIITTDKTIINNARDNEYFFTYKIGEKYIVDYYQKNIERWQDAIECGLSNWDAYEFIGDCLREELEKEGN